MNAEQPTQREYWNGKAGNKWVAFQETLDEGLAPFGKLAIDALALRAGEQVLDIGCGCGATSIELAGLVGDTGSVLGVDLSEPMLERAKERSQHLSNVAFRACDASTELPEERVWDALFSRFGVMFFEDPTQAFSRLLRALRPGGRMAFVCWAPLKENGWARVPMETLVEIVGPQEKSDPNAPGPFALADRTRLETVVSSAGFASHTIEAHALSMRMGAGKGIEDAATFAMKVGPASRIADTLSEEVRQKLFERLCTVLQPFEENQVVRLPAKVWCVRASRKD